MQVWRNTKQNEEKQLTNKPFKVLRQHTAINRLPEFYRHVENMLNHVWISRCYPFIVQKAIYGTGRI